VSDVVIIASGGANLASLQVALSRQGAVSEVSDDAELIIRAPRVILPGVGAAADAMSRLRRKGLERLIPDLKQPVLGICLGMQLLFDGSEEGAAECLGIIPGRARRLPSGPGRPVPHMGWNTLDALAPSPLLGGLRSGDYFYFVHSYALPQSDASIAACAYGESFAACVQWRNFFGTQFHPERSAKAGARLLDNFLKLH
jgi:glutamine amidotransferase